MKTVFEFAKPDDLTATITMTATVKEWRALVAQLPDAWPAWQVASQIQDVIIAAGRQKLAEMQAKIDKTLAGMAKKCAELDKAARDA